MRKLTTLLFPLLLFAYQVGDKVDSDILRQLKSDSKIVVVDFFASWCHSCAKELPQLQNFSYPKTEIVGVDVDEDVEAGRAFRKRLGLTIKTVEDPEGKIVSKFNPVGVPAIYIIVDGQVRDIIVGARDDIASVLKNHLARIAR